MRPDPRPELATLVAEPPEGDQWLHEVKFDGFRVLARLDRGQVKLLTRTGQDWSQRFGDVAREVSRLAARQALLDGEVCVLLSDGSTSFQALQNAMSRVSGQLVYFVFDLLHLDGVDLRGVGLETRKRLLRELTGGRRSGGVRYTVHRVGGGADFHRQVCRQGLEGMIAKRRDARYVEGRTRAWLKIKCSARQEFVIVGFTEPRGARVALGALLLGVNVKEDGLRYCGKVGTGFDTRTLRDLRARLDRLETRQPPVRHRLPADGHWVRPKLVAEVSFTGWTEDGKLRHPTFLGLREDKRATEVVAELPSKRSKPPAARGRAR